MTTHELARLLLTQPDLPVAVTCMGHYYAVGADRTSHGPLQVACAMSYTGPHIVIGNSLQFNNPNFVIGDLIDDGRGFRRAPMTPPVTVAIDDPPMEPIK